MESKDHFHNIRIMLILDSMNKINRVERKDRQVCDNKLLNARTSNESIGSHYLDDHDNNRWHLLERLFQTTSYNIKIFIIITH